MCAVSYFSDGSMFIEPRNPPEAEREGPCEGVGGAPFLCAWSCEFEFRDPAPPSRH